MEKRLYVAYGSNLNIGQMAHRCPTAKLYGIGVIKDYELQFKGRPNGAYATISPKIGSEVPVAVWDIKRSDEMRLDMYEGYPSHYFKADITVQLEDEQLTAMVYVMNPKMDHGLPSPQYYMTVYEGYRDCDLDTDALDRAVRESAQRFYSSFVRYIQEGVGFDEYDEEDEEYTEEPDEETPDITDPFYYSDGFTL